MIINVIYKIVQILSKLLYILTTIMRNFKDFVILLLSSLFLIIVYKMYKFWVFDAIINLFNNF